MLKTFYIQKDEEDIITDILEFPYNDYIEVQLNTPLPAKIMSGCYRLMEDHSLVYVENLDNNALMTKITDLESQLSTTRSSHSDLLLELDFRVMDIEDQLQLNPANSIDMIIRRNEKMNSTAMVVLDKIETGNYENREEIVSICDKYLSRNRISQEEYTQLIEALDKKEAEKN